MNFKEEKDLNKLETKLSGFVRTARTDIKPDEANLKIILDNLDVTKWQTERKYKVETSESVFGYSFFKNRIVIAKSVFGVGFATALLVAFVIASINVDLSRGDFGYQISSLEAEAEEIEGNFDSSFDEKLMQEELDMEFAVLEDELGL